MSEICSVWYSLVAHQIEWWGVYCWKQWIIEWSKIKLSSNFGDNLDIHWINKDWDIVWIPEFLYNILVNKLCTLSLKEFEELNELITKICWNKMKDITKCANSKWEYFGFRNISPCSDLFICEQWGIRWKDSSQILINFSAYNYFIYELNVFLNYINELLTSKACPKWGSWIYK